MIEVLASTVLAAIGIVGCIGAIGRMQHSASLGRQRETLINLAVEKYDEVVATTDLSQTNSLSGDFSDRNDTEHSWTASTSTINTSNSSNVVNTASTTSSTTVDSLSVTVRSTTNPSQSYTVTGLIYIPATTSTGTGTGTGTGTTTGGRTG